MPPASRWGAHIHSLELDPSVRGLRPRRPRQSDDEFGRVAPLEQQSIQHESRVEAARRPGADSRHLVDDPAEPLGIDVKVASVDLPREAIDHLRQGMSSHHPAYPCVRHPDVRRERDLGRERERCSCGVTGATHPVPRISSGGEIGSLPAPRCPAMPAAYWWPAGAVLLSGDHTSTVGNEARIASCSACGIVRSALGAHAARAGTSTSSVVSRSTRTKKAFTPFESPPTRA